MKPKSTLLAAGLCALAAIPASQAAVTGGSPDPGFGTAGSVATDFYGDADSAYDVAIQTDGKLVAVGTAVQGEDWRFAVARYLPNGTPDNSFGVAGKAALSIESLPITANSVAIQKDGKILVGGTTEHSEGSQMIIVRLTKNGALDTSFNSTGYLRFHISETMNYLTDIALQADGKIVSVGHVRTNVFYEAVVTRHHPNGLADTSFGNGGTFLTWLGTSTLAHGVHIQKDGKILVTGASGNGVYEFHTFRLLPNGTYDTTFGTGGAVLTDLGSTTEQALGIDLQPDGKIVIGGYTNRQPYYHFGMARYTTNGVLDTSFGTGGRVISTAGENSTFIYDLKVNADGKIGTAGVASNLDGSKLVLACYNPDGSPDTGFNTTGLLLATFGEWQGEGYALAWQKDGKIVAAGARALNTSDMILARYAGPPEIGVQQPAGNDLTDGKNSVDFGPVEIGKTSTRAFSIKNTGGSDLTGLKAVFNGPASGDFEVLSPPPTVLPAGGTHNFSVRFKPTVVGIKTAIVRVQSNDSDERSFDVTLKGLAKPKR